MADREKDPILTIEPADAFKPDPYVIELKFDDPKEIEGKYGKQFLYGVKHKGKDHVLFASQALDGMIFETGAKKGDRVAILRTGAGTDTRWNVRLIDNEGRPIEGGGRKGQRAPEAQRGASTGQGGTGAQAERPKPASRSYDERLADFVMEEMAYWGAFKRATIMLTADKIEWNVDANACAYVLHRMARDHGIDLGPDGDPVEPAAEPEPELPEDKALQRNAIVNALASLPDENGQVFSSADPDVIKDALALTLEFLLDKSITWATLTRDQAVSVHRYIGTNTKYEQAMSSAGPDALPF